MVDSRAGDGQRIVHVSQRQERLAFRIRRCDVDAVQNRGVVVEYAE